MARDFRTVTDSFAGLRECEAGEGRLKRGESPKMKNLRVTPDRTLMQRDGWEEICSTLGAPRALYADSRVIWSVGRDVYILREGGAERLGQLDSESGDVCIFPFNMKLYFLDGVRIKVWDGEVFGDIEPYAPLIAVNCDPLGAGTPFEGVNLLTGSKRQTFTPDGSHTVFKLAEDGIDRVDRVVLSGEVLPPERYSVNAVAGTLTFSTAPSGDIGSIEVTYTKERGSEGDIHRMRHAVAYGGDNDTRIFLWGDSEYPFHLRYSGIHDGLSGFEYFSELDFNRIGSAKGITSVVRHYDRLMIFTESEAFQCSGEQRSDISGMSYTVFPVATLSSEVGCAAENFAKLIDNTPITLSSGGLYRWNSSAVRDERNAVEIGERIRTGLKRLGTEGMRSFDRASESELFIWRGNEVYIYNYALDLFYYYEGFDAELFAEDSGGTVWFVQRTGALCRAVSSGNDNGKDIEFIWQSGYEEYSGLDTKNIHRLEFELCPVSATAFKFIWVSERQTGRYETLDIDYRVADFGNMLFDAFSFATGSAPVRVHKRIKAKRIRGFKLMIENDGDSRDFHMLSLAVVGRFTDTV